ncbi:MAG: aldo/keto reductase [Acidobacteriaceae bacterium]
MSTRRDFLRTAAIGSAALAATVVSPGAASASGNAGMDGSNNMEQMGVSDNKGHYKPPYRFALGGVPLGNEFAVVTDKDAYATIEAAWSAGVRYYDVAPWYGLGLAERRYGNFLHKKNRRDFVLSSKVGKLLKASKSAKNKELFPFSPSPNDVVYDYSASGVRRSIEDSLQRLGIDGIDIAFVHDISDNKYLPTPWQEQFEIARKGAFPELTRMREEGLIKGWGIGVNTPEPIMRLLEVADPDVCLLASQYSLIDHKNALDQVFPAARARMFHSSSVLRSTPDLFPAALVTTMGKSRTRFRLPFWKAQATERGGRQPRCRPLNCGTAILGSTRCCRRSGGRGQQRTADSCGLYLHANEDSC